MFSIQDGFIFRISLYLTSLINCRGSYISLSSPEKTTSLHFGHRARKVDFVKGAKAYNLSSSVQQRKRPAVIDTNDDHPSVSMSDEEEEKEGSGVFQLDQETSTFLSKWSPPRYLWRGMSALILAGQVIIKVIKGKIHWKNTLQQLERVGPKSVGVCLLTSAFVGMAFTIQFVREFTRLGLNRSIGGVLALAFSRELSFCDIPT